MPQPFRSETLATIRRRVGYLILGRNNFFYATASGGSTSSISADFIKRFPDNFFAGKTVYIVSGTGAGQSREVSASTQSTGTLTPAVNFTTAPDATSVFEVWSDQIQVEDVNAAINLALLKASDIVKVYVETTSPTVDTTRLIVTIPATYTHVAGFRYYDSAGATWYEYLPLPYLDAGRALGYTIQGNKVYLTTAILSSVAGSAITIMGYRLPAALSADTDLAEVRSDYLALMAAVYLEASQAEGPALDPEQHSGRAANWLREAQQIEARMPTSLHPNTVEIQV